MAHLQQHHFLVVHLSVLHLNASAACANLNKMTSRNLSLFVFGYLTVVHVVGQFVPGRHDLLEDKVGLDDASGFGDLK